MLEQSRGGSRDGEGEDGCIGEGQRIWDFSYETFFAGTVSLECAVGGLFGY